MPDNVTYGQITGRFTSIVADGSDPDNLPDAVPLSKLSVIISSSVSPPMLYDVLADPPQQISLDAFKATTNADGDLALSSTGPAGIWVPASDNPNMGVTYPWTYTVTVSGAPLKNSYSYTFVLPTGGTVDLATVTQITAQPSTAIQQWQAAVDQTQANVATVQEIVGTLDLSQYVKTINGVAPDSDGNVVVTGGSGGVTTVNGDTGAVTVDVSNIPGATTVGRQLMAAANQAAGRAAIQAGTSSVVVGTASGQAADAQVVTDALATKADLDTNGIVKASQLPSYIDNVQEYADRASFPAAGIDSVIYVALDTNYQWRWGGSSYIQLTASPGTTDAVPEGSTNLYFTDARAQAALATQLALKVSTSRKVAGHDLTTDVTLAKGDVGLSNVDNTSDLAKPISTATQAALDAQPQYLFWNGAAWDTGRAAASIWIFYSVGKSDAATPDGGTHEATWIPDKDSPIWATLGA